MVVWIVVPAATDTTKAPGFIASTISAIADAIMIGFTANTTTSAPLTHSLLLLVVKMPSEETAAAPDGEAARSCIESDVISIDDDIRR